MCNAFESRHAWQESNTAVIVDDGVVNVALHGNVIARREGAYRYCTLAGWDTVTTRSRLNALGAHVRRVKGRTCLDYGGGNVVVMEADKWYAFDPYK